MKSKVLLFLVLPVFIAFAQVSPPANLTATVGGMSWHKNVKLTWQYQQSYVQFNIYKKAGALADTTQFHKIANTYMKHFTDMQVLSGGTYCYYVTAVIQGVESDPSNIVEITVNPPIYAQGKISGTLFSDVTSLPVIGRVNFLPYQMMGGHHNCVFSDSTGFFSAQLPAGQYYMHFSALGYVGEFFDNVSYLNQATLITLNDGDSLVFNVGLNPQVFFSVTGWVKDQSSNPVQANMTAYIVSGSFGPHGCGRRLFTTTDPQGNFEFMIRENDTIVVQAVSQDPVFLPQFYNNKTTFNEADRIAVTGNITDINFTLLPRPVYQNGISGDIKDSAGINPLKGKVHAYKKVNGWIQYKGYVLSDSLTGVYNLTNLEPGEYVLFGNAPGYRGTYFKYDGSYAMNWRYADSVVVSETGIVTEVNFRLREFIHWSGEGYVYGNVSEGSNSYLEGAVLFLLNESGEVIGADITGADGSYIFENVAEGRYTLHSSLPGYKDNESPVSISPLEGNAQIINVTLTPEQVTSVNKSLELNKFELAQNYPNPFNPVTTIKYSIPEASLVTLKVYNILGNEVAVLVNQHQKAGAYKINFNASNLASGIYFYKLETGNYSSVKKLTLLK